MTSVDTADLLLARLRGLDSCVVSDSIDALGHGGGSVLGIRPMWEGAKVVGRAMTVTLAEYPPPNGERPVHLGIGAIESSGRETVIVIDNNGRTEMGCWGGLLSLAAAENGVAGVVLDGACRDVDEARELHFPAFARAAVQRTARGRVYEKEFGQPASVGGVRVEVGDLVIADGSGVVFLAAADADEVLGKAEDLQAREQQMQAGLRAGITPSTVLGENYQKMLH